MEPRVIGISAHFHDSAACLLCGGDLVAAAEEERFSRVKYDAELPVRAYRWCLQQGGLSIEDVDCVAYYEDPVKKLGRQLWMGLPGLPPRVDVRKLDPTRPLRDIREGLGHAGRVEFVEHHQAHAASAFYFSGFPEAAILTADGVGEWTTTSFGRAGAAGLELLEQIDFPDSLGLFYSAITSYLGFGVNDGEYKVMGLAPYGEPRQVDLVQKLVRQNGSGRFRLDMKYFDFLHRDRMYSDELPRLFGRPPRERESGFEQFHKDLARSAQVVLEDLLLGMVRHLRELVDSEYLCMAGGVALNCVANGRIRREGPFKHVFVQPAANDAGACLGAAAIAHQRLAGERVATIPMRHAFWGPSYSAGEVEEFLDSLGVAREDFRGREGELVESTASRLGRGQVVGWFQGPMEFGPRALGARSILADPRDVTMRDRINALVKKREAFRPFAPAVLESETSSHFDLDRASPFMLETCAVTSPLALPAITHVDKSARVQTVAAADNPRFARLLTEFKRQTGCPILLNTSFNMRDEPIVCSPEDALRCFVRSEIDALVVEDFVVERRGVPGHVVRQLRGLAQPGIASATEFPAYTFL